ncbi:MAG: lipopolysaccharide heptosyltransferase II, partial [Ignavibacteriales bacterium]|nr:lipopolysaccharide heptosyltransferase II [Ignavibacteriales bacterium]
MIELQRVVVIQTAFLGDVVLTLPLIQKLKQEHPDCLIDVVVIPRCTEILKNHPDIHEVIVYDKRKQESGISGFLNKAKELREKKYDWALVPHRSVRSAALARLANIPRRVGFSNSAGRWMFTDVVLYKQEQHEVVRNLQLLKSLGIQTEEKLLPRLYPSEHDHQTVTKYLEEHSLNGERIVAIAPGTVWNTKRWLTERFAELSSNIIAKGFSVVLIGGKEDETLAHEIMSTVGLKQISSSVGKMSILQSAELIRMCSVLVTNDSAPMHLAVAMRTPVVAIFGATVPEFGFAPIGERDVVLGAKGLS